MGHRPTFDKAGRREAAKRPDRAERDFRLRQDRWWTGDTLFLDDPEADDAAEALFVALPTMAKAA